MRLKNVLIVVSDLERAKAFYRELFGLEVILDQEGKAILTEGLVLQEASVWRQAIGRNVIPLNHAAELYFEELDIENFARRLETYREPIRFVSRLTEHPWGQKVLRFYDPDGNLIEVGTPV